MFRRPKDWADRFNSRPSPGGGYKLEEIYERFHAKGRMLPDGLHYIDSWLSGDGLRCFQLMETENASLFGEWETFWSDLASFEVIALRTKPGEERAIASTQRDG